MEKLIDRARGRFKEIAAQIAGTLKGITYKADMAAEAVAKIMKGVSKGQQRTTLSPGAVPARRPIMDSRRRQTRRSGTVIGTTAATRI